MEFNTQLLHGSNSFDEKTGATQVPIFQAAAFHYESAEQLEQAFSGSGQGYVYTRIGNPSVHTFERRIANLEKGIGAVSCSSGMAAISLAVLNLLEQGDELVASSGIFSGSYALFKSLSDFGITARFTPDVREESFADLITAKTKLIFIESIGNPKMDIPDIKALAGLAHSRQIPLIVDNTVTSPYLLRPLELGADIVVHSTSKIINGSGNSIGGVIIDKGRFQWSEEKFPKLFKLKKTHSFFAYLAKLRSGLHRDLGACQAPFNAYLNCLGLETLGLRLDRICSNALALARFLSQHPQVQWVNYPGLGENPYHQIASEQFSGKYGILLTFGVGSKERAYNVINSLKYAYNLANIGDVRTLVIHPASTIYANQSPEERLEAGVPEDMIRVSVGIEDIEDLINDFDQALAE